MLLCWFLLGWVSLNMTQKTSKHADGVAQGPHTEFGYMSHVFLPGLILNYVEGCL